MIIRIPNMMLKSKVERDCGGRQTYARINRVTALVMEHPKRGWYTTKIRNQSLQATIRLKREGQRESLSLLPWRDEDDDAGGWVSSTPKNPSMVLHGENHGRVVRCGRVEGIGGLSAVASPYLMMRADQGDLGKLDGDLEDLHREKLELEIQVLRNKIRLQESALRSLQPDRFYDTADLEKFLKGRIKIEELRKSGLQGVARGYWGANVIDAISSFCGRIVHERVSCSSSHRKEEDDETAIFEKTVDSKNRSVVGYRTTGELEDSGSRSKVQSPRKENGALESLVSDYERLTRTGANSKAL